MSFLLLSFPLPFADILAAIREVYAQQSTCPTFCLTYTFLPHDDGQFVSGVRTMAFGLWVVLRPLLIPSPNAPSAVVLVLHLDS